MSIVIRLEVDASTNACGTRDKRACLGRERREGDGVGPENDGDRDAILQRQDCAGHRW